MPRTYNTKPAKTTTPFNKLRRWTSTLYATLTKAKTTFIKRPTSKGLTTLINKQQTSSKHIINLAL